MTSLEGGNFCWNFVFVCGGGQNRNDEKRGVFVSVCVDRVVC